MINRETLYEKIAEGINISEEMFDYADSEYKRIVKWIEENAKEYDIDIYPQGSFSLGTAIKPLGREDEYDVDLVCEYQHDYGFTAHQLKKQEVYSILNRYARAHKIIEKHRCWQVTYEHNKKFHLDVIPAVLRFQHIDITNQESNGQYSYIGSNPKGYIEWFQSKQKIRYNAIRDSIIISRRGISAYKSEIEPIKEYAIRTPLQKAIQILKRHRDVIFKDDTNNIAPVSIIITTIAADLYCNESSISSTLSNILNKAKDYVESRRYEGKYYVLNPSYRGENFADKWNEHHERAEAFLNWIDDAKRDLVDNFDTARSDVEIATLIESALGETVSRFVYKDSPSILDKKTEETEGRALITQKERNIIYAPHRQKLDSYPRGYRVIIGATVRRSDGTTYRYDNDSEPIDKNCYYICCRF